MQCPMRTKTALLQEGQLSEPQKFPAGWDDASMRDLITHYDAQNEDEQAAEIETVLD